MKAKLISSAAFLMSFAGALWGEDRIVVYPDYPSGIERDEAYAVSVRQGATRRNLVVWNHCEKSVLADRTRGGDVNRRFCEFAFEGSPVSVDIAVREDVRCYKVFPARRHLKHMFKDGIISVTLDRPCYFGIQLNDYDKTILSVFADLPERQADVPAVGAKGVLYISGWVDAKGADGVMEIPPDVKEVYLAPGSVLNARLKVRHKGVKIHGRGMVLDPLSDIFRYDQMQNKSRGLLSINAGGATVDGIKLVDARTFNFVSWGNGNVFRNVKAMSSMMCSDGFTNGGTDLLVENAWLYVGDNALVVSGVTDATYRNVVIGTSCKAIFPQNTNRGIKMENIDVFRADEGVIANVYNGVLRRNNKWDELGAGLQRRELGPQDLVHQSEEFFFDGLSAIDATYVGYVFRGRNMGNLPKTFVFRNLSVPNVPGYAGWRGIGKTNGVSIAVENDPKKWLMTRNYSLAVTNLYLAGRRAESFPTFAVKANGSAELDLSVIEDDRLPMNVALTPDRVEVGWRCPESRKVGLPAPQSNLLADNAVIRSIWQRHPSWLVKFDACGRDEGGKVLYRLRQCEKNAGMQAVITERVKAAGFGPYRLTFEARASNGSPFGLGVKAVSNDQKTRAAVPDVDRSGKWMRYELALDFGFDPATCDLASLVIATTSAVEEVAFRNFRLSRP